MWSLRSQEPYQNENENPAPEGAEDKKGKPAPLPERDGHQPIP
jgi:hypothetical protein